MLLAKTFLGKNKNKMPAQRFAATTQQITFIFDCKNCDYSCSVKTQSNFKMMKRLHGKKCKNTGRTDDPILNAFQAETEALKAKCPSKGLY